eukprot:TRINITY_DN5228_c0_g1_i1.p1 TRINITY_DN5228_c0_g1~~TRINITY_DN5228_c0_g1_i1.p1  ORF type:complete len:546 (-),score=123.28 TRINITY_DN5228_c0_g1_i1:69-1706(-)
MGRPIGILLVLMPCVLGRAIAEDSTRALVYLMKYGYVAPRNGTSALLTEEGLNRYVKSAVLDFQAFAGINQTGELDPLTVELMETPRCGVRDIIGHGATARRKKRYVLQGSRWRVNDLTYRVTKYPSTDRLSKSEVDEQMKSAFSLWEQVTDLRFSKRDSGSVHIEIRFEKYEHGDGDPFDGPGGTLAHAYFPQYGGDVHVDDTEYWTINSFKGTNILQTMTHELGHSLGLSHSDVRDAIMAPFYRGWVPDLKLNQDDIKAIQSLYGKKVSKPTPKPTSTPSTGVILPGNPTASRPNTDSGICSDPSIDVIFRTASETSYVFRGDNYWKLTSDSIASGYPRKIADDWKGLPSGIDAAFTWQETKSTYFFKGSNYWKFENLSPKPNYPKTMKEGFPGIPQNVDTAFVWGGNNKIYFFKGNDYWKFDPERKPHVRSDRYPKRISQWDLPQNMEGALQWDNGKTYFFKNGEYWRFNDRRFTVDRASPAFPRPTAQWWFGCPKTQQLIQGDSDEVTLSEADDAIASEFEDDLSSDYSYVGDEDLDVESY